MSTELPIACSLSAGELPARQAQMAELGRDALFGAAVDRGRAELRFTASSGIRERVESFAAAERECCAFLTMRVVEARGEVCLTIEAPEGAEPVLEELVSAFEHAPPGA